MYRQVLGANTIAWHPAKGVPYTMLKEISSNGDTDTGDVVSAWREIYQAVSMTTNKLIIVEMKQVVGIIC